MNRRNTRPQTSQMAKLAAAAVLILSIATLGGCTTTGSSTRGESLTAEQVAQSRFRARWWNYYERAKAYEVLGEWEKAESDLRSALAKRSTDQRWARTYGLHFMPEYFPKRELGFVLYKQEEYDDALKYLEQSMNDQQTARAAYYVDECRSVIVARDGADRAPPQIRLVSPPLDTQIPSLALSGEVEFIDDTYVRRAWIDGEPVLDIQVSEEGSVVGPFSKLAHAGVNELNVRVEDIVGNQTESTFTFNTDHDGPAVSFDQPVTLPGTVSGVAFDRNGVESFTVAGRPATLSSADGVTRFEVSVRQEDLAAPVVFRAEDAFGNVTQNALPGTEEVIGLDARTIAFSGNAQDLSLIFKTAAIAGESQVSLGRLESGLTTTSDSISVHITVDATAPVASLALTSPLGTEPVEFIPNALSQSLTRRVSLQPDENAIEVTLVDDTGRKVSASTRVIREHAIVDGPDIRLSIALLDTEWEGVGRTDQISPDALTNQISTELRVERVREGENIAARFSLVDRESLSDILLELELSALTKEVADRVQSGRIKAADLVVRGKLEFIDDHLNARLEVVDSERITEEWVEAFIPVDSGNPRQAISEAARNLALLLEQTYPRVSGKVVEIDSDDKLTTEEITIDDGVRRESKCLVFKRFIRREYSDGYIEWRYYIVVVPTDKPTIDPADLENLYVLTK